jgi:hypothetical protein
MPFRRIALSAAGLIAAASLFAEEPPCATNYHSDGKSAETWVLTTLTPQAVIQALPANLNAAGASMQSAEPEKGVLKATGLDVSAEPSGSVTRVTFRSTNVADKAVLCRYASLVGSTPPPPAPPVPQDPALIAQMKNDLVTKHQIFQPGANNSLNTATFTSPGDFLELTIAGIKDLEGDKRLYEVTILLPRKACMVAREDMDDVAAGFGGRPTPPRTKPVLVNAVLVYINAGGVWKLADATISHLESTK